MAALLVLSIVGALIGATARVGLASEVFTNPLLDSGADPWVTYDRGYYYGDRFYYTGAYKIGLHILYFIFTDLIKLFGRQQSGRRRS